MAKNTKAVDVASVVATETSARANTASSFVADLMTTGSATIVCADLLGRKRGATLRELTNPDSTDAAVANATINSLRMAGRVTGVPDTAVFFKGNHEVTINRDVNNLPTSVVVTLTGAPRFSPDSTPPASMVNIPAKDVLNETPKGFTMVNRAGETTSKKAVQQVMKAARDAAAEAAAAAAA